MKRPVLALLGAFSFAWAALAAFPVPAADNLELVRQRVAQVQVLRGGFEQEKRVAGFRNPLRSQGRFLLSRDKGVVWTTLKPFPSEMVITRERILSRDEAGNSRVQADAKRQPALRQINAMMFALMAGDVSALAARFDIDAEALPGNAWSLTLKPKAAALEKVFSQIELHGDHYVREVEILEAGGDRTVLKFVGLSETPARLDADEARRFD